MNKMKILVPGAGPIIIGQAAEFDYSGSHFHGLSLRAKGSRESVNSAVEFLDSKIEEEFISEGARDPIKKIMRRFTKYR